MSEFDPKDEKKTTNLAMALAASQMGLFVAAGLLGGLWIDRKFNTTPLLGILGIIVGFAVGVRLLIRLVRDNR